MKNLPIQLPSAANNTESWHAGRRASLHGVSGLVAKTWIRDGSTLGGFHIFASREAADSYLKSDMVAGLTSNEAFSEFLIRHFDVLEEFSALTGSPEKTLA